MIITHKKFDFKKLSLVLPALLISASLALFATAAAGTVDDPLVTLSYLNGDYKQELLASLMDSIDESYFTDLKAQLTAEIIEDSMGGSIDAAAGYEVVRLTSGQSLTASGACEIILRSGKASVFVTSQENIDAKLGLSDCTDGGELTNGEDVPLRHLLIIPRADGRGVTVTSTEAYFMVRGEYKITG